MLMPGPPAQAACKAWDLGNQHWGAKQSNGYILGLNFTQKGTALSGNGYHYPLGYSSARTEGALTGNINGSEFNFTMKWRNGTKGIYTGFIAGDGTISGNTRDAKNRNSRATWFGAKSQKARCVS
jgi:hypothetical protein